MAGMVKTTPAATESLADPVVWTMLFSRIDVRPRARKIVIESTAMGMEELTVSPILSARYTLEALKINPSTTPRMRARGVSSAGKWVAGMYGSWSAIGGRIWPPLEHAIVEGFVTTAGAEQLTSQAAFHLAERAHRPGTWSRPPGV